MARVLVDVRLNLGKLEELRAIPGITVQVIPFSDELRELPETTIRNVEVLFCTFPPKNVAAMEALRWIQIASSGYSQLFGLDLPERGVRATNARGCFDVPI